MTDAPLHPTRLCFGGNIWALGRGRSRVRECKKHIRSAERGGGEAVRAGICGVVYAYAARQTAALRSRFLLVWV